MRVDIGRASIFVLIVVFIIAVDLITVSMGSDSEVWTAYYSAVLDRATLVSLVSDKKSLTTNQTYTSTQSV